VLIPVRKLNEPALQFLILSMNKEQLLFQFEFYNFDPVDDPLLEMLASSEMAVRAKAKGLMPEFAAWARQSIDSENKQRGLSEEPPERFVVVSQCRFDDNYYAAYVGGVSILALGNWKRVLAPPSFAEFVQALLVREAIRALCPSLGGSGHLGTKGCLLDATPRLVDARQKVLHGYVCHYCHSRMEGDGQPNLGATVTHLLDREWLGQSTDPRTPAGVMVSLKYDLFTVKGREETRIEAFLNLVRQESAKQLVVIIGGVVLAVLLFVLGLKTGSR
jgi:hypothetical protein